MMRLHAWLYNGMIVFWQNSSMLSLATSSIHLMKKADFRWFLLIYNRRKLDNFTSCRSVPNLSRWTHQRPPRMGAVPQSWDFSSLSEFVFPLTCLVWDSIISPRFINLRLSDPKSNLGRRGAQRGGPTGRGNSRQSHYLETLNQQRIRRNEIRLRAEQRNWWKGWSNNRTTESLKRKTRLARIVCVLLSSAFRVTKIAYIVRKR